MFCAVASVGTATSVMNKRSTSNVDAHQEGAKQRLIWGPAVYIGILLTIPVLSTKQNLFLAKMMAPKLL